MRSASRSPSSGPSSDPWSRLLIVRERDAYFERWSELHGGYDPRSSRVIAAWLTLVYALARPLAAARLAPDVVTASGALISALAVYLAWLGGSWVVVAAVVVALSGLADSLDGAVAVIAGRTTKWGFVLDSLVDRISDVLYLVALWLVGAPGWLCVVAGGLMGMQEYARARAGNAGMGEIGVIAVSERPTRVIVTAMFLLNAGLYTGSAGQWATAGVAVWVTLHVVGLTQLLVVVRRRLGGGQTG